MRAMTAVTLVAALSSTLWLPTATSAEDAPVPEDYTAPLTSVEVFTAWEVPRSTVSLFYTDPVGVDTEALEEALDAEDEDDGTLVQLSDRFLFDFDSAELRPTAEPSLDTLVALLADTGSVVEVTGHTDGLGTDEVNQPLSQERAEAVADYLVEQGIEADRITSSGAGSSEPVADNTHPDGRDNPEGRQANRRVEVRYSDG